VESMTRTSKYETHVEPYLNDIKYWRKDGLTEEQIADKLHIAYSTFKVYKNKNSALSAILKNSKETLIKDLKISMYNRAMGYEYEETRTLIEKNGKGKERRKVEKHKKTYFSDTLLIFALKKLDPNTFGDIINDEIDIDDGFIEALNIEAGKAWDDEEN
jgi:hypothetical protein